MREWTSKILGGFSTNKVSGSKTNGTNNSTEQTKQPNVQMTRVYAQFDETTYYPKSTNTFIPDIISKKYDQIPEGHNYQTVSADQTVAFYNNLKQEGMNDVDRASDRFLEEEPELV